MKENLYEFGLIGNNKIKTINIYTEPIAAGSKRDTLTYRQAFDFLNTYLESIYMIPDNFKFDAEKPNDKIPSQWEFHYDVSIQGEIKDNINPNLEICGILETMTDNTQMAQAVDKALKERYGGLVYETTISKRIEAANSTAEQKSLISKKNSVLGGQYRELVTEILGKEAI